MIVTYGVPNGAEKGEEVSGTREWPYHQTGWIMGAQTGRKLFNEMANWMIGDDDATWHTSLLLFIRLLSGLVLDSNTIKISTNTETSMLSIFHWCWKRTPTCLIVIKAYKEDDGDADDVNDKEDDPHDVNDDDDPHPP